jgi:FkbM family methyltransferase
MFKVIRELLKKRISIDSYIYQVLKKTYYGLKKLLDFLYIKIKYPHVEWIYIYKKRDIKSNSQYGQDLFILNKLGHSKKYVEVGANHPVRLSNSLLLEQNGWEGISIDPLKKYTEEWKNTRKNQFINCAIGKAKEYKKFIEFYGQETWYDMLSGFKDFVRNEDLITFEHKEYDVEVLPLNDILKFKQFDLLMVDVEGAELEVLKGIDLSIHSPEFVLLENAGSIGGDKKLRTYMQKYNYLFVARLGCADDLFKKINK